MEAISQAVQVLAVSASASRAVQVQVLALSASASRTVQVLAVSASIPRAATAWAVSAWALGVVQFSQPGSVSLRSIPHSHGKL